jgi:hypothetical protein
VAIKASGLAPSLNGTGGGSLLRRCAMLQNMYTFRHNDPLLFMFSGQQQCPQASAAAEGENVLLRQKLNALIIQNPSRIIFAAAIFMRRGAVRRPSTGR